MTAYHLRFRVSREPALDADGDVWYAGPVDAPMRSGVTAETLADLHEAVENVKHFVLDVPKDVSVTVEYVYDLPEIPDQIWQAHQELRRRLTEAGLSADDRALLLLSA